MAESDHPLVSCHCRRSWIGASFYFIWLDNHLREPPQWKKDKGIKGDLWAIHGGGIYEVAKYQLAPEKMPGELHWFKWEAYSTFISGMALLFAVYYFGNPGYLIDASKVALSTGGAVAVGLGTLAVVMLVYEALIRSPLARHGLAFGAVLYGLLVLVAWGLFQVFAGRGAYIHVGAVVAPSWSPTSFSASCRHSAPWLMPSRKGRSRMPASRNSPRVPSCGQYITTT